MTHARVRTTCRCLSPVESSRGEHSDARLEPPVDRCVGHRSFGNNTATKQPVAVVQRARRPLSITRSLDNLPAYTFDAPVVCTNIVPHVSSCAQPSFFIARGVSALFALASSSRIEESLQTDVAVRLVCRTKTNCETVFFGYPVGLIVDRGTNRFLAERG